MLAVVKDDLGRMVLACEWHLVNEQGILKADGQYVWLEQLESSTGGMTREMVSQLIKQVASTVPWATSVYWQRRDKPGMVKVQFNRGAVLHYAEKGVRV